MAIDFIGHKAIALMLHDLEPAGIRKWEVTSAGRIAVYCGGNLNRRTNERRVTASERDAMV